MGLQSEGGGTPTPTVPGEVAVVGLELLVWGYPQRWRVISLNEGSDITIELATPIAFV